MSEPSEVAAATELLPILDYISNTYLINAKMPQGAETTNSKTLIGEIVRIRTDKKIKDKTPALIEFKRSLTPFQKHILECASELNKINTELSQAVQTQNAEEMSRNYFRIAALLVRLKLYRDSNLPIDKMDAELTFEDKELQFLDHMLGMDLPFLPENSPFAPPIVTTRETDVDKRQLVKDGEVINEDFEEPLRIQMRDFVKSTYGIERVGDFTGTKKPFDAGVIVKNVRVKETIDDIICFHAPSQFLTWKYMALRRSTYRPLDIERKESGGYRQKRLYFKEENGKLVETNKSMISVELHFMDPGTISTKLITDISMISQTLAMGAKKIDNDFFFNVFYHIQNLSKQDLESGAEAVETVEKREHFEPSTSDDRVKHRDRISADQAMLLINELSQCDRFIFGGNLDLDVYLDGIGIRKKPNVLTIEGEGLACFDYINNLIMVPTLCPQRITPLETIVSALADFRYALWIDSPKDIFDQQGVGFQIIGSKSRSGKPLWAIFPTKCSALIKQRAFREYYKRHIFSFLYDAGVKCVSGYEVPMTNKITDSKLRQYFTAYVPLAQIKESGTPPENTKPEAPDAPAPVTPAAPTAPAPKPAAPVPPKPAAAAPAPPPPPKPKPATPTPTPPTPKPATPPAHAAAICPLCDEPIPPNSKFCLNCGTPTLQANKCPSCGAELPPGSKFCNICGTKIG
jgi:hypothetical protein